MWTVWICRDQSSYETVDTMSQAEGGAVVLRRMQLPGTTSPEMGFPHVLSVNLPLFLLYSKLWERKDAEHLGCREEQGSCGQRQEEEKEQSECSLVDLKQRNRAARG